MTMSKLKIIAAIAVALPLGVVSAPTAHADTSPWSPGLNAELRLVSGGRAPDGTLRAGLEIRLAPKFKTYWRSPGDSGIPPLVSFEGSDNLAEATVRYPAPEPFPDGAGGTAIGYRDAVVFPVSVRAKDPGRPVTLVATVDYAVCDTLCIPNRGSATLSLPDTVASGTSSLLSAFEAQVPEARSVGAPGPIGIEGIRRSGAGLDVVARVPEGVEPVLLVEAPTPWFLAANGHRRSGDGRVSFTVDVLERPADAAAPQPQITLTLIAGAGAVEVTARAD